MKITKKQTVLLSVAVFILVLTFGLRSMSPEDSWECENGAWVAHGKPSAPKLIGSCDVKGAEVTDVTCKNNADCTCGVHKIKGICFWGNGAFVASSPTCKDFCQNKYAQCVSGECVVK